jgi:YaiO family outer membrane protein
MKRPHRPPSEPAGFRAVRAHAHGFAAEPGRREETKRPPARACVMPYFGLRCRAALLVALAATLPAARELRAQPSAWQVEAGVGAEHFTGSGPTWRQTDLALRSRFAPRSVAELNARRTHRAGLDDNEIGVGLALPLDAHWSLAAAAAVSPTHRALAQTSGSLALSRTLGGGWVLGAGLSRSLYDTRESGGGTTGSSTLRLNAERYAGAWRFALGLNRSRLDGGTTDNGWVAQTDRYIGERGRIGLIYARGRELESLPPNGVLSIRVETVALVGVWPISSGWALTGALGSTRNSDGVQRIGPDAGNPVGSSTRRNALRLGVQHDF